MKMPMPGKNTIEPKIANTNEQVEVEYSLELIQKADLSKLFRDAFATAPWFENLDEAEGDRRADSILLRKDVKCLIAKIKNEVVGCILFDTLDLENLKKERGEALANWAAEKGLDSVGWEREVMVSLKYQSMGIGQELRDRILKQLEADKTYQTMITRMRDDNVKIIKGAEKFGYRRTGVRLKSPTGDYWHEYWYKDFY